MAGETAERSRVLSASPTEVWAVLGDVTRMAEWSEVLESVDVLEGDGRRVGSRFRGNNRDSETHAWSMTCVIDKYVPEKAFEFHTEGKKGETRTRWWYHLEPAGPGTKVSEGFLRVVKLSRIGALAEKKILGDRAAYNAENIDKSLARLADLVESN